MASLIDDQSAESGDSRGLQVEDLSRDGKHTLILSGEVDLLATPDLKACVSRLCIDGTTGIVIDLRKVTFMDSTGLRAVLSAHRICAEHGYEFSLIPGPPNVQSLFELTGLAEHLPFQQDGQHVSLPPDAILPKLFTPADRDDRHNDGR
jgi:anti-sigma B factor antagonist